MVGVWQSVVRELDGSVCASTGECGTGCVCVCVWASTIPPSLSHRLHPSLSRASLIPPPADLSSPSFNSRRPSPAHACSTHPGLLPSRSLSLPPTREHHPLLLPPTITSLSLVDPPSSPAPSVPPIVATWLCAHAHAHTDTCRSRQERVKRFWL